MFTVYKEQTLCTWSCSLFIGNRPCVHGHVHCLKGTVLVCMVMLTVYNWTDLVCIETCLSVMFEEVDHCFSNATDTVVYLKCSHWTQCSGEQSENGGWCVVLRSYGQLMATLAFVTLASHVWVSTSYCCSMFCWFAVFIWLCYSNSSCFIL